MKKIEALLLFMLIASPLNANENKANYLMISDNFYGQEFNHESETSGNSSFYAMDSSASMNAHDLKLSYGREFLESSIFSFTIGIGAGIILGRGEETVDSRNISYQTKIKNGYVGSAEFSINLNFFYSGLKIQPFFGTSLTQRQFDYETNYSRINGSSPIILIYDNEVNYRKVSIGSRFIDNQTSLMSYFSLSYLYGSSGSNSLQSGEVDGARVTVVNNNDAFSSTKVNDLSFTIGAGYAF